MYIPHMRYKQILTTRCFRNEASSCDYHVQLHGAAATRCLSSRFCCHQMPFFAFWLPPAGFLHASAALAVTRYHRIPFFTLQLASDTFLRAHLSPDIFLHASAVRYLSSCFACRQLLFFTLVTTCYTRFSII